MTELDDISKQRLQRHGEEIAVPLHEAIEACALASIDYDRAFHEAAELCCSMLSQGASAVRISMDADVAVGEEHESIPHEDIHAMAIGLIQKRIADRTEEILQEWAAEDGEDEDGGEDGEPA